ncbi:T9SS type A sorting domain-containing protein [Candidatus Acetothermia bacterium]|nr:T9SS type A sorting domain-containing protein [Candidatus Acetothermia bacterium]
MRVTKTLSFLIATLIVVSGLSFLTVSASAGPLITGTSAFGEALKELKILLNQSATLQRQLAKLNLEFKNLEGGLGDLIDQARNLLAACDGEFSCEDPQAVHEAKLLLEQAQRDKARILVVDIGAFSDLLHEFEVGLGEVEGKVGGLKEIGRIPVSDATDMEIWLDQCNELVTITDSEIAEVSAYLEDGDVGEDPNDPDPRTSGADDVNDFIAIALHGLSTEESLDDVDWALANAAAVLDQAVAAKDDIEANNIPECRSDLKLVQKRLAKVRRNFSNSIPHLNEQSFGANVQVYTLSGASVTVSSGNALSLNQLANGVYVVVTNESGRTRVEKLVVLH